VRAHERQPFLHTPPGIAPKQIQQHPLGPGTIAKVLLAIAAASARLPKFIQFAPAGSVILRGSTKVSSHQSDNAGTNKVNSSTG